MPERSKDWINQALKDIEAAEELVKKGFFEWACFISQQAAEKAVKALLQKLNAQAWGHAVFDLLRVISKKLTISDELYESAKALDKYYIPTRYPNSFESGHPHEYFTEGNARDALIYSKRIIEFCDSVLA